MKREIFLFGLNTAAIWDQALKEIFFSVVASCQEWGQRKNTELMGSQSMNSNEYGQSKYLKEQSDLYSDRTLRQSMGVLNRPLPTMQRYFLVETARQFPAPVVSY